MSAPLKPVTPHWTKLWMLVVIVSPVSEIVFQAALGSVPRWLIWVRILVLIGCIIAAPRWTSLMVLRPFALAYLVQLACMAGRDIAVGSRIYALAAARGFAWSIFLLDLLWYATFAPVLVWCLRRPQQFFLRAGRLTEPVYPYRIRWPIIAPAFAIVAAACAWGYAAYAGAAVTHSWAIAPVVVLLAAINAFGEEFLNRNLLIGALQPGFGASHGIAVSAFIFGIGHWNGLPSGVLGVLMTAALGVMTGVAMVQTKGMFWSWFMHFIPDCVLAYYWAVGSVAHETIGSGRG